MTTIPEWAVKPDEASMIRSYSDIDIVWYNRATGEIKYQFKPNVPLRLYEQADIHEHPVHNHYDERRRWPIVLAYVAPATIIAIIASHFIK